MTATLAAIVGVKERHCGSLVAQLGSALLSRRLLLVFDNFEHLLPAAALIADLLATAPELKVLITSRAPLRLSGEQLYPVAPLPLPDPSTNSDPATLGAVPASALFVARARSVRPDFQPTAGNAPAVATLCARLDGLPLAIELAAARMALLTPEALVARLTDRLALLRGGPHDLPARLQSLRAMLDWSHSLLSADERILFRRLAVFSGGCSLAAAEAVCGAGDTTRDADVGTAAVFDLLAALVAQSMVQRATGMDGEPRFTMLETIQEYALERLQA